MTLHKDIQELGELSKDGVFIYNLDTRSFEYINDVFATIFNTSKEQLLREAKLVLPCIRTEDTEYLKHRLAELKQHRTISDTEFRLQFENGDLKHLSCDAYLIDARPLIAGFVKDYTKEKEHEDFIINYGARKDTLLDMLAHNLSGPLNLSQNILKWMQQTHKIEMSQEISFQLHLIQDNMQHCLDIVNDFLKKEHMESERVYVKKSRFDVLEKIIVTVDKLIATNKDKKFRLITELETLNISTDSVKFFQIIHNLVSNSIKFTRPNGQIDIILEETKDMFVVRVRDDGIGIPADLHPTLFDRRTPARRDGLNKEKSTGLGLSIVKTLVELLGGRVLFETSENAGSVFSIELPKE